MKWITLLSSKDYLMAVLVLNQSLQNVQSQHSLIVAVTDDILSQELVDILLSEKIQYYVVKKLQYNDPPFAQLKPSIKNTASKIQIFSLPIEEKLIYLDADMLVQQNIDELFEYPLGSSLYIKELSSVLSGLFVFTPNPHEYDIYSFLVQNKPHFLDGDIMQTLWFSYKDNLDYRIPADIYFTEDLFNPKAKIIHYNEIKPFLLSPDEMKNILHIKGCQLYLKEWFPLYFKYKEKIDIYKKI